MDAAPTAHAFWPRVLMYYPAHPDWVSDTIRQSAMHLEFGGHFEKLAE